MDFNLGYYPVSCCQSSRVEYRDTIYALSKQTTKYEVHKGFSLDEFEKGAVSTLKKLTSNWWTRSEEIVQKNYLSNRWMVSQSTRSN